MMTDKQTIEDGQKEVFLRRANIKKILFYLVFRRGFESHLILVSCIWCLSFWSWRVELDLRKWISVPSGTGLVDVASSYVGLQLGLLSVGVQFGLPPTSIPLGLWRVDFSVSAVTRPLIEISVWIFLRWVLLKGFQLTQMIQSVSRE